MDKGVKGGCKAPQKRRPRSFSGPEDPLWVRCKCCGDTEACMITEPRGSAAERHAPRTSASFSASFSAGTSSSNSAGSRTQKRRSFEEAAPAGLPPCAQEWTILVAEDNKVNQMVVCRILKGLGVRYQVVENGRLALEACQKARYDLVLMVSATQPYGSKCCGLGVVWPEAT